MTITDYDSPDPIAWCPACGDFNILQAVKQALVELKLEPWQVFFVTGIGQAPKLPHYLKANLFNGLHGRSLPVAIAAKLVNKDLVVIVEGGDGDGYAEGGNHFIHALRRNIDLTYLVHDNQVYGLTKGQLSPTSDRGMRTTTTPLGAFYPPVNPLAIAIALNAGFVARGFSGDPKHLTGLIRQAIEYPGFALVDILQNCVSYNKVNTFGWYRKRVYKLDDEPTYDPKDRMAAFARANEWPGSDPDQRIPIGVFYRLANHQSVISNRQSAVRNLPALVNAPVDFTRRARLIQEFH